MITCREGRGATTYDFHFRKHLLMRLIRGGIGGILLLLLLEEPEGASEGGGDDKDDEEDLATVALGLAGLKLGLERLNLFAAALVSGVTAVGGVLDELRAHVLGLELSVIVVVGAAGVLSTEAATGVRDRLAGEFVVGGCGLRGAVLVGEEAEHNVGTDNLLALAVHDVHALGANEVLVILLLLKLAALVILIHLQVGLSALGIPLEVEISVILVSGLLALPGHVLGDGLGVGVDADDVVTVGLGVGAAEGAGIEFVGVDGAKAVDDGGRFVGIITLDLLTGEALDELHAVVGEEVELILLLLVLIVLLELTGGADELAGGGAGYLARGGEVDVLLGGGSSPGGGENEGGGNLHGSIWG